jgi:hypothetical protein
VKQNDLGEYEENTREKQKMQVYKIKHQIPLKPSYRDDKHKVPNSRGQQPKYKLSQSQKPYPPKIKANKNKHQTQTKTPTPPEVKNTRFHQFSLDKPQDKLGPLKQQSMSMLLWPKHNCHK